MTASAELVRLGLTAKGLRLQKGMEFEEWRRIGEQIAVFDKATQWAFGDWWFYGEWEYGSMYEEAMEVTGLTEQALKDLKYVAGRFELSRRRDGLSLSHHREVAALPLDEADRWLDLAELNSWSREKLRQALSGQLQLDSGPEPPAARRKVPIQAPSAPIVENRLVEVPEQVLTWTDWSDPVQIRVADEGPRLALELRLIVVQ